jgi:nucleotide-binding universal stress UspA family protein
VTDASSQPEARIVVGVDGSKHAANALRWAAELGALLNCDVEVVMAWVDPRQYLWSPGAMFLDANLDPRRDAELAVEQTVKDVFGDNRPDELRTVVENGSPAKVLLDRSANARMLVVGSRGHGGFAGLLLGSVSSKCAEHSKRPVLVVHD